MTYKTLKPLYLNGVWHGAGTDVPSDVPGFDYEKAARKGQLAAPEGEEVRNVAPQPSVDVQADAPAEDVVAKVRAELEKQLKAAKKTAEAAEAKLNQAIAEVAQLKQDGQELAQVRERLDEYQTAVGDLLPEGLTAQARKALIDEGYVGRVLISLLTDAQLDAVSGVAAASIQTLREWAPFAGVVPAEGGGDAGADAPADDPAAQQ